MEPIGRSRVKREHREITIKIQTRFDREIEKERDKRAGKEKREREREIFKTLSKLGVIKRQGTKREFASVSRELREERRNLHLNRVSRAYVGSSRSRPIRRRPLECPLDYFSRSGSTKGPLPKRDVEVTAIKICFGGGWRCASRGTAWPLEQVVVLEGLKERVLAYYSDTV